MNNHSSISSKSSIVMVRTMHTARKRTGGAKPKRNSNLHAAIRKGGTELVKKLISDPNTDVNATDGRKVGSY